LLGRHAWTFAVGERRLAYLAGGATANLWVLPLAGAAQPRQVTQEAQGVYDYDISPDGTHFVYAVRRADGGADLRSINTDGSNAADLVLCPNQACVSPAFSPDGQYLAYERHTLVKGLAGDLTFGPAQVDVRSLADGSEQVLGDSDARFPRWGPDGRLGYLDTGRAAIVVQDLKTGSVTYVPNASGEMGTWSPDGQSLIFSELFFPPEATPAPNATGEAEGSDRIYNYLVKTTIATNATQNLSGANLVDDASPAYTPSGAWLAFGRKSISAGQWTPGRQLWLMRPDGSEAHALTNDPLYNHSAFRWGPDGAALAYMRFNVANPSAPAEIWLADITAQAGSANARRLVNGYLPEWLP
jgi:Tol biopolymer transport system component